VGIVRKVMAGSPAWADAPLSEFTHEALFYTVLSEQIDTVTEFVFAGLARGDRVVVALGEAKVGALREKLGPDGGAVQFVVVESEISNPTMQIPFWRSVVDSLLPGQGCRGVSEPLRSGMTDEQIAECQLNEALLNAAFDAGARFWLLCTYDELLVDEANLNEAHRSHRYVATGSEPTRASAEYDAGGEDAFYRQGRLMEAPHDAQGFEVDTGSVGMARQLLFEFAHAFGMTESAAADCALAGHEVIANSLKHGGGTAHLSFWRERETLICEVRDRGRFDDPLAGRTKPSARARGGRGLWIANQLCDLVQVRSETDGTVVRLHMCRSKVQR
jgi:anti-sigma regulatory factor (Ser/Thr protein kinase)